MRLIAITLLACATCGAGCGLTDAVTHATPHTDNWTPPEDATVEPETGLEDATEIGREDTAEWPDARAPDPGGSPDIPSQPDIPPGDGELGEPCVADGDCKSLLCWANADASGCTVTCKTSIECQPFGLVCTPMREGVNGCAPPPQVGVNCASHQDCAYPTACLDQFGWCDMPECTFEGDCAVGSVCAAGIRKCQPVTCKSNFECANPMEFCLDGECGAPQCKQTKDCGQGEICSKAQGLCTDATPCQEGQCSFYNQICVNGLCEPDLCAAPCSVAGHQCNPDTGKCGPPCPGASACPAGWGCADAQGICYQNLAPYAVARVVKGGNLLPAANLPAGSVGTLDGTTSFDPEGASLLYRWTVLSMPAGSPLNPGTVFCQKDTCVTPPLPPGQYLFGLWVEDEVGTVSMQAAAAIWVQP